MLKNKTLAAIVAAISLYLQEEQQAVAAGIAVLPEPVPPVFVVNLWGIAGRNDAMKLRSLWQLGIWKK